MNHDLIKELRDLGLVVTGHCGLPGEEDSVVVGHSLTSPKLNGLDEKYRLTPSGPRHVIVSRRPV